jgi:DNA-binding transcriptional LysR family regulator
MGTRLYSFIDRTNENLMSKRYATIIEDGTETQPLATAFDLDAWLVWPHILVSGRGDTSTLLDAEPSRLGLKRRVGLVVPNFQMVPALLRGSDMVAMLPSRVIPGEGDMISFAPPIPVSGFPLHLAWHRRRAKDAAVRHVTAILGKLLQ